MTTPVRTTWVETIEQDIEQKRESYLETSHRIHATPEIGNEEFFASRLHAERLTAEGFTVELGVAGHDTAFFAKKSSDRPGATIAFLAEYDALPGIGHACGHNIIGTTSVAAAIALSKVLDEVGGSVVVLGTPAEEGEPCYIQKDANQSRLSFDEVYGQTKVFGVLTSPEVCPGSIVNYSINDRL